MGNKKLTTELAIVALVAATVCVGITPSVNTALAGSASGNGAIGHTGACHELFQGGGATHQHAVDACGPSGLATGFQGPVGHTAACHKLAQSGGFFTHQETVRLCGPM